MMRSGYSMVLMLLLLAVLGSLDATAQEVEAAQIDEAENTVEMVLTEVQKALVGVQRSLAEEGVDLPPLQSVTVTLQTVLAKSSSGGFRLLVFSFKRPWERQRSHQLVLTLSPSDWEPKGRPQPSVARELEKAIIDAAKGVQAAREGAHVPLELTGLQTEIGFVVRTGAQAGAGRIEILPVTFGLSRDLSKTAIQRIRLTFKRS